MNPEYVPAEPVTLTGVGIQIKTEQIRRRSHRKIPMILGTTVIEESWPIRSLTATAYPGEVLGVFDTTASRESLVLRIMCGRLRPDEGQVSAQPRAALITQPRNKDFRSLSMRQTIHMLSGLMGMTDSEIKETFDDIVDAAEVSSTLNLLATEVDIALIRQVAFSAGIRMPTQQFAFDRTLPMGTQEFQKQCPQGINRLRDRGAVLIAHIPRLNHIKAYVDRGLILDGEDCALVSKDDFIHEVTAAQTRKQRKRRQQ